VAIKINDFDSSVNIKLAMEKLIFKALFVEHVALSGIDRFNLNYLFIRR